jgi:hypothetical protein
VLVTLALSSCGGGAKTVTVIQGSSGTSRSTTSASTTSPSTSTASTTSNAVLGQTQSTSGLTVQVNALKRTSSDIVELDFTVINNTANSPDVSELFGGWPDAM